MAFFSATATTSDTIIITIEWNWICLNSYRCFYAWVRLIPF
jgi:hypothetical protein